MSVPIDRIANVKTIILSTKNVQSGSLKKGVAKFAKISFQAPPSKIRDSGLGSGERGTYGFSRGVINCIVFLSSSE